MVFWRCHCKLWDQFQWKWRKNKQEKKSLLVLRLLNIFLACHWNVSTDYFAWNKFNICFDGLSFLCKIKTFSKVRLLIMLWKINLVIHIDKKKEKERNEEWKSRGELKIESPGSINFRDVAGLIDWVTSSSRLSVCLALSNTHTHTTTYTPFLFLPLPALPALWTEMTQWRSPSVQLNRG